MKIYYKYLVLILLKNFLHKCRNISHIIIMIKRQYNIEIIKKSYFYISKIIYFSIDCRQKVW